MRTGLKISILIAGVILLAALIAVYRSERRVAALTVQMLYYPIVYEGPDHSFWHRLSADYGDSVPSLHNISGTMAAFQGMLDSLEVRWTMPVVRKMYLLQAGGALESYTTPGNITAGEQRQLWGSAKAYFEAFDELRIPDMIYNGKRFPVELDSARNINKHWLDMFRKRGFIWMNGNVYRLDDELTQFELAFILNYLRYAGTQAHLSYMAPCTAALDTILKHKIKDYRQRL